MNAIFKLTVLAVMAALFALVQPESGTTGLFQTASTDTAVTLAASR